MYYRTQFNHLSLRAGFLLSLGTLIIAHSMPVGAQTPPPAPREFPPSAPGQIPPSAPREMPLPPEAGTPRPNEVNNSFSGEVERYLLTPQGFVEGLILENGLQVKFPPHMGESVVQAVKVGDQVQVMGHPGTRSQLGQEVATHMITNTTSGRSVLDQPPTSRPAPLSDRGYSNFSVSGTATTWIVGGDAEILGIILSDGSQVRFPAYVGKQLSNRARSGASVQAQGFGIRNSYGQALEATSLTVDGQTIATAPPSDDNATDSRRDDMPEKPFVAPPDALPEKPPVVPPDAVTAPDAMPGQPPVMPPDARRDNSPVPPPPSNLPRRFRR